MYQLRPLDEAQVQNRIVAAARKLGTDNEISLRPFFVALMVLNLDQDLFRDLLKETLPRKLSKTEFKTYYNIKQINIKNQLFI